MTAPRGPWGPPPWPPPAWQQPWGPAWGPPPPLPPVVPARYVPGGREPDRPDGTPPPRWLWVAVSVVAALVLVAGVVVALVLAGGGSDVGASGARPAASAEPLLPGAGKRPVRLDDIPATVRLEPALTWDRAVEAGPDGAAAVTALRFVQAIRARDWFTVYQLCAAEVRAAARARAVRLATDPPTVVGAAFYGDELRGEAIAGGAMVAVEPHPAEYLVTFRLRLADDSPATVTLWVSRGYAVRDWT